MLSASVRRSFTLLACLMLLAIIVPVQAAAPQQEKVEITFYEWITEEWSDEFVRTQLIEPFETAYPDIKVTRLSSTYAVSHDKYITLFQGEELPDVMYMIPEWYIEFAALGMLYPLDEFMERDGISRDEFVAASMPEWEGQIYAIPTNAGCSAIFYNKRLFEEAGVEPPKTWEEFIEISQKLTKPEENQYALDASLSQAPPDGPWYEFFPWLYEAGGVQIENGEAAFNSEAGVKALQLWVDLINEYQVVAPGAEVNTYKELRDHFAAEQTAMHLDGPWFLPIVRQTNPDLDFGVAPFPQDVQDGHSSGGQMIAISSQSEKQEAAWEFVKFMTSEEINLKIAEKVGFVPTRKVNLEKPFITDDPYLKAFAEIMTMPNTRPTGTVPEWANLSKVVALAMQEAVAGVKTPQEALDDAVAAWNEVLPKYMK